MIKSLFPLALAVGLTMATQVLASDPRKPTIVLVHDAFADASSWDSVVADLEKDGYTAVAVANPLRSVASDADYVQRIVKSIGSPVVLVGHSYGGSVISQVSTQGSDVKALVFVAAFAPDVGESALALTGKFPGSTLPPTLGTPVVQSDGANDLYIKQDRFHDQFAADVPEAKAMLMAAGQRPVTDAALGEANTNAGWKALPSWFVYGDADRNIPPQTLAWMAERARSKETVVVKGASHVVMVSNPDKVAKVIEDAAESR